LQLCKFSFTTIHLTMRLLPAWFHVLEKHGLVKKKMPCDVATCWNSTYDMLEFAVEYRVAIDDMTMDRAMNLRKWELRDEEWVIASQLCDTLKHAMQFFSRDTPNLTRVILVMDYIDEYLSTAVTNMSIAAPICAGSSEQI
ncbi:hypothetical protein CERSUDRAFT_59516, partial [Gelatoporia subvermispora B]